MPTIKALARLCRESYEDQSPGWPFLYCGRGPAEALCVDAGPAGGIIAISGTDERSDWFYNLDARKTKWGTVGKVHQGFYAAFFRLWTDANLRDFVDRYSDKTLTITGHSLGGAVASLLAVKVRLSVDACQLVTFGSPRVFGFPAPDLKLARNLRVVHRDDIVPSVPVLWYQHAGELMLLNSSQAGRFARWASGLSNGWEDHDIGHYVEHAPDLSTGACQHLDYDDMCRMIADARARS